MSMSPPLSPVKQRALLLGAAWLAGCAAPLSLIHI